MIGQGTWGTCPWELDDNGNLTIFEGTGAGIRSLEGAPWHRFRQYIYTVQIANRVDLEENSSLSYMFSNCENLQYADFSGLSTTNASAMNCMFQNCGNLLTLDLSGFDTSRVISMSWMFRNCKKLKTLDLSGFNTSRVTGMSGLFSSCDSLESLDLSHFDTSNVVSMISMFMNCSSLTSLDLSAFNTGKVTDMSWMFCNCTGLIELNISGFYTGRVVDMSQMFSSCKKLSSINLSGFATYYVKRMENMFLFCDRLKCLDLSAFDTRNVEDMTDMFNGCRHLCSIVMGKYFSMTGNGDTQCEFPLQSIEHVDGDNSWKSRNTGVGYGLNEIPDKVDDVFYIEGNEFQLSYVAVTEFGNMNDCSAYYATGSNAVIAEPAVRPPVGFEFKEWNTKKNGRGMGYQPGQESEPIYSDVNLFAIWISVPSISELEQPEAVTYGNKPIIIIPKVYDNNSELTSFGAEISLDGTQNWTSYDLECIPSVQLDGYYLRFYASNAMGTSYSNYVNLVIDKAKYDMTSVRWKYEAPITYNGQQQSVILEGLPKKITVDYEGNTAITVGKYVATAKIIYDEQNYEMPGAIEPCPWEIKKAVYDMSRVLWDYNRPFTYNGNIREVSLTGLYGGLTAKYENNKAQNAGTYEAVAVLGYDEINYEKPEAVDIFTWGIDKADINLENSHWNYEEPFTYDGMDKTVCFVGLPDGVRVEYMGNTATDAGVYQAVGSFVLSDEVNYNVPEDVVLTWEICKRDYNMDQVCWNYCEPFAYDGSERRVYLENLPTGVSAEYFENIATGAGEYEAHVSLTVEDSKNYNTPEISFLQWRINKAYYNMTHVKWSYSGGFIYDGSEKEIALEMIPEGLAAIYEGNSASLAGEYVARVSFEYDEYNYFEPTIGECHWTIEKAIYDMDSILWANDEPLVYDGKEKVVYISNLPPGVTATYEGNTATDAGIYYVSACIHVEDQVNYRDAYSPKFMWEIKKSTYNMDEVRWSYEEEFEYDGTLKEVKLLNLPEGIRAEYSDNSAVCAADYIAIASFEYDDKNYEMPSVPQCRWKIAKAQFKIDSAFWNYTEPYTYDGEVKRVEVNGLPEGIIPHYSGNKEMDAGIYQAKVVFDVTDNENYYPPEPEECMWLIQKSEMEFTDVQWASDNDLIYNGEKKEVYISNLPEGITVTYEGNTGVNAGEYEAIAYFDASYNQNYDAPKTVKYKWSIQKAIFDTGNMSWIWDEALVYDGTEKTVYIDCIPDGLTVKYEGNQGKYAGEYKARAILDILDKDNYYPSEPVEFDWSIEKGKLETKNIHWVYDDNYYYDGTEKTVKLEGLPEGVLADVDGEFAIEVGKYKASAVLHAEDELNYSDPIMESLEWEIHKGNYDMSNVRWEYEAPFVYDGSEKIIKITGLPHGVRAEYTNNTGIAAGEYNAVVSFTVNDSDNYNIPEQQSLIWEIRKGLYDMSNTAWHIADEFIYDGREKEVYLTGLCAGITAVYSENKQVNAGEYIASAHIIGDFDNYEIPKIDDLRWTIDKAWLNVETVHWNYQEPFTYDEGMKEVLLDGLPEGVGVKYYSNKATGAGQYVARAELILPPDSNYKAPEIRECSWEILKADYDMSRACWVYSEEFVYDGSKKGIEISGLPNGVIPHYRGNEAVNAGEYEAEVSFIYDEKNYFEPIFDSFKWRIKKASYDMSGVKWSYITPFTYDGNLKMVDIKQEKKQTGGILKLFKSNNTSYLCGLPEGVTAQLEGNSAIDAGDYVATAVCRVEDPDNYEIPEINDCHWSIQKADYNMNEIYWSDDGTYVYDGKEKYARLSNLPEGVSAVYSQNKAIDAGSHMAHADFEIIDENNYNVPEGMNFRWTIRKASYDMSSVEWDYDKSFVYDEQEKSVHLLNLPAGVSAVYKGNSSIDAGVFIASADLEYDVDNYEKPVVGSCKWKIAKASYDVSGINWDYEGPFYYDGAEKAVKIKNLPEGVTVAYEHNRAIAVGIYTAKVTYFYDEKNYYKPEAVRSCRWEIKEADAL